MDRLNTIINFVFLSPTDFSHNPQSMDCGFSGTGTRAGVKATGPGWDWEWKLWEWDGIGNNVPVPCKSLVAETRIHRVVSLSTINSFKHHLKAVLFTCANGP